MLSGAGAGVSSLTKSRYKNFHFWGKSNPYLFSRTVKRTSVLSVKPIYWDSSQCDVGPVGQLSTLNCTELKRSCRLRLTSSWGLVLWCNYQYSKKKKWSLLVPLYKQNVNLIEQDHFVTFLLILKHLAPKLMFKLINNFKTFTT